MYKTLSVHYPGQIAALHAFYYMYAAEVQQLSISSTHACSVLDMLGCPCSCLLGKPQHNLCAYNRILGAQSYERAAPQSETNGTPSSKCQLQTGS